MDVRSGAQKTITAGSGSPVVATAGRIVLGLLAANIAIDFVLRAAGLVVSMNTVVPLTDVFGDYFRFVTSYPGGDRVTTALPWLLDQLHGYADTRPTSGLAGLKIGAPTHFNAPPLNTLFGLVTVRAMRWIDPALLYAAMCLLLLLYWAAIVRRFAPSRIDRHALVLLGVLSYPMLLMLVRGNVYAGLTGLLIVHAMLIASTRGSGRAAAILLAIALGMRPNAVVFVVPLIALCRDRWPTLLVLAVATPAISGAALFLAHLIYPTYTLATFAQGVRNYYLIYVIQEHGVPFGSSLYGALTILFPHGGLTGVAPIPAGVVGLSAMLLYGLRRIRVVPFVFLICAAYCLGSTIIADYHLFVFMVPVMLAARTAEARGLEPGERIALIASCLMLAPKNYLFEGDVSIQPLLNPLLLLAASTAIVAASMRSAAPKPIPSRLSGRCHAG